MGDASLSFADQAKQLLADFQHAMDTNAPVSSVMMSNLKALIDAAVVMQPDPTVAAVSTEGTKS